MSTNPYETPLTPGSGGSGDALAAVNGPAIGLLVAAGVGMAVQVLGLIGNVLGVGLGAAAAGGGQEGAQALLSGGLGILMGLIGLGIGVVVVLGALKMKKLESYGFSMVAAILAMIPCLSPCCLIGLPVGIWALIVMNRPEVKAAFR